MEAVTRMISVLYGSSSIFMLVGDVSEKEKAGNESLLSSEGNHILGRWSRHRSASHTMETLEVAQMTMHLYHSLLIMAKPGMLCDQFVDLQMGERGQISRARGPM